MMRVMVRTAVVSGLGALGLLCATACGSDAAGPNFGGTGPDGGGVSGGGAGGSGAAAGGIPGFETGGAPTGSTSTKKLDLLLMVDNSATMVPKQAALGHAVENLIARLPNVEDVHVGVITSSIGSHGATTCESTADQNDHAHLLPTLARGTSLGVPNGFVEWTPSAGVTALTTKVQAIVDVAGQAGCGFEAQLEAVYRFLADPFPPQAVTLQACNGSAMCAAPQGVDSELLAQRKAFLRPDSAVAIVLLSDESDCSTKDYGQNYFSMRTDLQLPAAASVCATNPNDPCCYSCAGALPAGCTADPACASAPMLTPTVDSVNLRCFDQKRRFGIDFLYPIQRYVNALRSPSLCTTSDDLSLSAPCAARADGTPGEVKNPLFSDLSGAGGAVRDASMVYLLGIVGVPWQDLAASKDAQGQPFPATELHYQSPADLASNGAWDKILGNDEPGGGAPPIAPTDPHMRPSRDPRPGLPGPSATYMADPINGHEWNIVEGDDLEYACIFALPQTGACSDRNCDCYNLNSADNNPLCQAPGGTYEAVQHFAKAYPGLRELELVKSLGPNGIPASICARNLVTVDAQDYGYGPAMDALGAAVGKSIK